MQKYLLTCFSSQILLIKPQNCSPFLSLRVSTRHTPFNSKGFKLFSVVCQACTIVFSVARLIKPKGKVILKSHYTCISTHKKEATSEQSLVVLTFNTDFIQLLLLTKGYPFFKIFCSHEFIWTNKHRQAHIYMFLQKQVR